MPYVSFTCTKCKWQGQRYHNVTNCPQCSGTIKKISNGLMLNMIRFKDDKGVKWVEMTDPKDNSWRLVKEPTNKCVLDPQFAQRFMELAKTEKGYKLVKKLVKL